MADRAGSVAASSPAQGTEGHNGLARIHLGRLVCREHILAERGRSGRSKVLKFPAGSVRLGHELAGDSEDFAIY